MELRRLAGDYFRVPAADMNVTFWFGEDPTTARYAVTRTGVFTRAQ